MRQIHVCILIIAVLFLDFCTIYSDPPPEMIPAGTRERKSETTKEPGATQGEVQKETEPAEKSTGTSAIFESGVASWYGPDFHGKRTANGEIYDMNKLTAAHQKLAFHTLVEVENIDNRKKVVVRINDRGPFVKNRIIDLSKKAALRLGLVKNGTAPVHLRILKTTDIAAHNRDRKRTITAPPTKNETITLVPLTKPGVRVDDNPGVQSKPDVQSEPIVRPEPAVRSEPVARPDNNPGGKFFLQVGAFSSRKNADRKIRHLTDVMPETRFRVRVEGGLFKVTTYNIGSRVEAEKLKKQFKDNGFDVFIKEESN